MLSPTLIPFTLATVIYAILLLICVDLMSVILSELMLIRLKVIGIPFSHFLGVYILDLNILSTTACYSNGAL